jgi:hypothetical protein
MHLVLWGAVLRYGRTQSRQRRYVNDWIVCIQRRYGPITSWMRSRNAGSCRFHAVTILLFYTKSEWNYIIFEKNLPYFGCLVTLLIESPKIIYVFITSFDVEYAVCTAYVSCQLSRWPCDQRRRSAAVVLLGSRVRIPLRAWMFVVCCVGSSLCDELITRPEDSYRLCLSTYMWSRDLNNQAAYAHFGLLCHRRKNSRQDEVFWEI